MDLPAKIKTVQFFTPLSAEARQSIAAVARLETFADGQIIMLEGSPDAPVFWLVRGSVRVFRTGAEGREQVLTYLKPGAALNIPAAFADDPASPASATAIGPVEALIISAADFRRVAGNTPELALAVLRDLSNKLKHFTDLAHNLSLRSVRGRLACYLLQQAQEKTSAPVQWTQEELATQLGTVRVVISRTLRAFVEEGLIKMDRHRIELVNIAALEREAEQ